MADEKRVTTEMEEPPVEAAAPTGTTPARPKRKRRRRGWVILGVVVAVIVVAGAGMMVWHEQPSFCSTMCHIETTYVDNYEQAQGVAGTDKYGNAVSNTNAMMAVLHRQNNTTAKSEIVCVDCHVPNTTELAHDGVNYVTGNYYQPRSERSLSDLEKWDGKKGEQFCVNENCHAYLRDSNGLVDRDKLEATTATMEFNPHAQHHQGMQLECSSCHKGHRASVLMCTACHEHEIVALPDGWVTYQESQELMEKSFS